MNIIKLLILPVLVILTALIDIWFYGLVYELLIMDAFGLNPISTKQLISISVAISLFKPNGKPKEYDKLLEDWFAGQLAKVGAIVIGVYPLYWVFY